MSLRRSNTTATTATMASAMTSRTNTGSILSENELPEGTTAHLLIERLRAWKHACGTLEDYCDSLAKIQKTQAKEMTKVAQTVQDELREREHFDSGENGVAALFKNLHTNTVNISNLHNETERQLRTAVLPILDSLHTKLKTQAKEVNEQSSKTFKRVEKSRHETQKVLENLAAQASHVEASRDKLSSSHDPLVIDRHVQHKFNKQINEENINLSELKVMQERLRAFEVHVVQMMQDAFAKLNETMIAQAEGVKTVYATLHDFAANIPPEYEWAAFFERNSASLINQDTPPRSMANLSYPCQDHPAVKPLLSGPLQRKSRVMLKGWEGGYWAISRIGFLHGFKDEDPVNHEWEPDMTLYLPECTITKHDGAKFSIKGKNVAGAMSAASMSFDMHFQAASAAEAQKWVDAIQGFIDHGRQPIGRAGDMSTPVSPVAPNAPAQGQQGMTTGVISEQPGNQAAPPPVPARADTVTSAADREAQQAREDAAAAAATPPPTAVHQPQQS